MIACDTTFRNVCGKLFLKAGDTAFKFNGPNELISLLFKSSSWGGGVIFEGRPKDCIGMLSCSIFSSAKNAFHLSFINQAKSEIETANVSFF